MSKSIGIAALGAALALASASFAQASASAPAGSTGLCKDGSYYSGASKKGACAGHKGVREWYAADKAAPVAAPAAAPAAASAAAKPARTAAAPVAAVAPGGGPGMVWVDKSTKAYHCSTDQYYGKTKDGEYLSEANAKAQGFHAAHGNACQ
jgi:Protein of unknown function (DUF3761)